MNEKPQGFMSRNRSILLALTFCAVVGSAIFSFWWKVRNTFSMIGRGTLEVLTVGKYHNPASPEQAANADVMVVLGLVGVAGFGVLFLYILMRSR